MLLGEPLLTWLPRGTAFILPKAEVCVRNHVQPYIPSILEALMVPTSQGFTEVRDVFFKEVTDMNLNVINEGGIDKLGEVRPAPALGGGLLRVGLVCPRGPWLCDSGQPFPSKAVPVDGEGLLGTRDQGCA